MHINEPIINGRVGGDKTWKVEVRENPQSTAEVPLSKALSPQMLTRGPGMSWRLTLGGWAQAPAPSPPPVSVLRVPLDNHWVCMMQLDSG